MNKRHPNLFFFLVLGLFVLFCGIVTLPAQEVKPPDAKKEDKPKPIKDILPDAQKIDGLITLYRKKEKLYAEIKGSNLNTDYLIAMAIAKGSGRSAIGGYTIQNDDDDWLWQFRKVNDNIQVVRRNIHFKADSGTPEAEAVKVAYSDSILYNLPILATGDGGGDVIDMASIFMTDLPKIGRNLGGSFARDRSTWGEVKGFTNNIEFRVVATYSAAGLSSAPDGSSVGTTIHYSLSRLPSSGYSSRLADSRIGYFTTTHKNYSRSSKDEHLVRYINRWNLQKADSSAELSPPKKPIIFWIEKTVPFKYRNAVREGILEWNKAFEKVGIVNAIEVRQQSDTDTWDAEDINYNTIRWTTSDAGLAMGPSHVNPLTGEILDADIIFDADWVDHYKERFDFFISDFIPHEPTKPGKIAEQFGHSHEEHDTAQNTASNSGLSGCYCSYAQDKASQLALASLHVSLMNEDAEESKAGEKKDEAKDEEKNPEETKKSDEKADDEKKDEKNDAEKNKEENKDEKKDGDAKKEEKKDEKKDDKAKKEKEIAEKFEQIVLAGIKDVVMHEVGHTLGLRHNFKASSWLTLEEINKPDRSKEFGIAGSVMDYLPINIAPKGQPQGDYFMVTLGPYDYLAIEYGYKIGSNDAELKKIAAKQAESGYNFATDEDTRITDTDPLTALRDLGANPLDFAQCVTTRYEQLLPELLDRAVKEGESYKDVGRLFVLLMTDRAKANLFLARNVGGLYVNRDHRGDPNNRLPIQVVDAKKQRESVDYLCKTVFAAGSFKIPPELYNRFGEEKWLHWNSRIYGAKLKSQSELILNVRNDILAQLLNPRTLERLEEMQLRVPEGEDIYTVDELFESLTSAIFKELETIKEGEFTTRKPAIELAQRFLQGVYFERLATYALGEMDWLANVPPSSQAIARQQLTSLESNIQALLSSKAKLDTASRTHLLSLQERIKKTLNADIVRQP